MADGSDPDASASSGAVARAEITLASMSRSRLQEHAGERILFVDDDPRLLDGIRRRLGRRFEVETAVGPEQGLAAFGEGDGFAIVVADMNMPGMNGAAFLGQVRERSPDTVRMMLTGNADLDTAISAVNDGSVFRFMTKPVARGALEQFLEAGLEHRRMASAMRRVAAAEEASRAKSDFLATVSHELRTPLTVIRSSAEILESFSEDEPAEVRAEFVATIRKFAGHLDAMIDELLVVAELDASENSQLAASPFDVREAVAAAIVRATEILQRPSQPPVVVEKGDAVTCSGEVREVERALTQILLNACRAAPADAPVEVQVVGRETEVTVDVVDRGPGVACDVAERIFEPFVQCQDVLTGKPPGLGLGLTIARRIVERHGGSITYSRVSDCTHFTVTLPRRGGSTL